MNENDFEDYKRYMKMKRKKTKPKQQIQTQPQNLYSNNQSYSVMPMLSQNQPNTNYKKMLQQAKQKREYNDYVKQQRTQKIKTAYGTARQATSMTRQAGSKLFAKAKMLYDKKKKDQSDPRNKILGKKSIYEQ